MSSITYYKLFDKTDKLYSKVCNVLSEIAGSKLEKAEKIHLIEKFSTSVSARASVLIGEL